MTRWGALLLLLFLVLGLTETPRKKAITLSICVTTLVLTGFMAKHVR
jgi:hypothetical protein